jgi:hypothetical protein
MYKKELCIKFVIYKNYTETHHRIREKNGGQNIVKKIKKYQEKWLQHVQGMDTNRIPKQALQYKLKDKET